MSVNMNNESLYEGLTNVTFADLETVEGKIENVLNTVGYIPFVSIISASARQVYAVAQIVVGVTMGIFCAISYFVKDEEKMLKATYMWFSQVGNGLGNALRASFEEVPIIGNIATAIYDNAIGLRMAYKSEDPEYNFFDVFYFKKV